MEDRIVLVDIKDVSHKTSFNSLEDWNIYPKSKIKCINCEEFISLNLTDLKRHQSLGHSNLSDTNQKRFNDFARIYMMEIPNSFIDYYCPICRKPIRLYYESWAGGRHGEFGFQFKFIITIK